MRTTHSFALWVLIALATPAGAQLPDPVSSWDRLSKEDRDAIIHHLNTTLPASVPEAAQPYVKELLKEIPRWAALGRHLENGDYGQMVGLYGDELAGYVDKRIDAYLPPDGAARTVFTLVRQNPASAKVVFQVAADPRKTWSDVGDALWNEVTTRLRAESRTRMRTVVRDVVNIVTGDGTIRGNTAGDLYLMLVESWIDAVHRFGETTEASAADQLYRQYRLARASGNAASAEQAVRDLWVTEYVPDENGRRLPVSWTARLVRMGLDVDQLIALFQIYYATSEGQQFDMFHSWLEETSRTKLNVAKARKRAEARAQLEAARDRAQAELRQVHILAARALRAAIEARLTPAQLAARDSAIAAAEQLLTLMRERNVGVAKDASAAFRTAAAALDQLESDVLGNQSGLRDLEFHLQEARRLLDLGTTGTEIEAGLGRLETALVRLEEDVTAAASSATATCDSARQVRDAADKTEARRQLESALQSGRRATDAISSAESGLASVVRERDEFLARMRKLSAYQRETFRDAQSHLSFLAEALLALKDRKDLEAEWQRRHAAVTAAAAREQTILGAFETKAQRIADLLAPHHADARIDAVQGEVDRLRTELEPLRVDRTTWADSNGRGLASSTFPEFETPDATALREARALIAEHVDIVAIASVAEVEAGAEAYLDEARDVMARIDSARFDAENCSANALLAYDQAWLGGASTRAGEEAARDAASHPERRDVAAMIVRIQGHGFIPHYAGGSYEVDGYHDVVVWLKRDDDPRAKLQELQAHYLGDDCKKEIPAIPGLGKRPVFWSNGPQLTVMDGPQLGDAPVFTHKREDTWHMVSDKGPSFGKLRERFCNQAKGK